MKRQTVCGILAVIAATGIAPAQEFGTFEQAKAMLQRAASEVEADKQRAFASFNANDPRFRDRDLFVFCFGADGKFSAHEALVSKDVRELSDKRGTRYGEAMFRAATAKQITEVSYLAPFPGTTSQVPKKAFVLRIGEHVCGVSAYVYNGPGTPIE